MTTDDALNKWMVSAGLVTQSREALMASFTRCAERMRREGHRVPATWWGGTPLEQNLMVLHVLEAKLRRRDLDSQDRDRTTAQAHELRNLIAMQGGFPSRGHHA